MNTKKANAISAGFVIIVLSLLALGMARDCRSEVSCRLVTKSALVSLCGLTFVGTNALVDGPGRIGLDKWEHLAAGFVVAATADPLERSFRKYLGSNWQFPPVLWSFLAGAAKETFDASRGGKWDVADALSTGIGGSIYLSITW